jgi:COMPASS component SWD1
LKWDLTKRKLHLENEDVDVVTIEPARGEVGDGWNMPVILDLGDTESEGESPGPGERRRRSPGATKGTARGKRRRGE